LPESLELKLFSYKIAHLEGPGGGEHALARHLDDEDRILNMVSMKLLHVHFNMTNKDRHVQ